MKAREGEDQSNTRVEMAVSDVSEMRCAYIRERERVIVRRRCSVEAVGRGVAAAAWRGPGIEATTG